jgi:hypothetical protein
MCLSIKEKSCKQTAKKDIVCYKFLEQRFDCDMYQKCLFATITPFMFKEIVIGNTYASELKREVIPSERGLIKLDRVEIGLHSMTSKQDCIETASHWVNEGRNQLIVRCIIPKGSQYYVGTYQSLKSYASTEIQYVEVVETLTVDNVYSLIKNRL